MLAPCVRIPASQARILSSYLFLGIVDGSRGVHKNKSSSIFTHVGV